MGSRTTPKSSFDPALTEKLETWIGSATFMSIGLASPRHCGRWLRLRSSRRAQFDRPPRFQTFPNPFPNNATTHPEQNQAFEGKHEASQDPRSYLLQTGNSFYSLITFNPIIYSHPVVGILTTNHAEPILLVNTFHKEKAESTPGHRVFASGLVLILREILGKPRRPGGTKHRHRGVVRLQRIYPDASFSYVSKLIQERWSIKAKDRITNARIAAELCNAGRAAVEISLINAGTEQDAVRAAWTAMYNLWAMVYPSHGINEFGSLEGSDFYAFKPWVLAGRRT